MGPVSLLCALIPLAALAFLTVLSQMSGDLFLAARGAGTTGVSVIVLGGTLCGALAERAYWLDVRRGGLLLLTVGLLGCGNLGLNPVGVGEYTYGTADKERARRNRALRSFGSARLPEKKTSLGQGGTCGKTEVKEAVGVGPLE